MYLFFSLMNICLFFPITKENLERKAIPIVKKDPYSISRPWVGHTIVHQEHQCGIRVVKQPYLHVEGSPQQFIQGSVVLSVITAILGIWDEQLEINALKKN